MLAIIGALVIPATAQVDQGRIAGTVRDDSGAVIPGVTVNIKNERTGEERTAVTGDNGDYLVVALRPSVYTVTAMLPAFANSEITGIQLNVGQKATIDLTLKPAGVAQEVTVSADEAEI